MDKNAYKSNKATEILGKHYQKLFEVTQVMTKNLNKVIDYNQCNLSLQSLRN